jgi:hypothetical protein
MKKLSHFATALANNTLSKSTMTLVKGGTDSNSNANNNVVTTDPANLTNAQNDEKRRERPGGGISTN